MSSNRKTPGKCSDCGEGLDRPGYGRWRYCKSLDCAHRARRKQVKKALQRFYASLSYKDAWQRAHKLLQRNGLTGRDCRASELFEWTREALPESRPEREERAWESVQSIRASMAAGHDASLEDRVVALLRLVPDIASRNSALAKLLYGHCSAILRDLGATTLQRARKLAENSTRIWAAQQDYLQLAVSILTEANLKRIKLNGRDEAPSRTEWRTVERRVHLAFSVAQGLCQKPSQKVLSSLVQHQAMRWATRIAAVHANEPGAAKPRIEILRRLGFELEDQGFDASRVWIDTLSEELDYFRLIGKFESAEARLNELRNRTQGLQSNSPYNELSLLRTEIELLLAEGNENEAIELIEVYIARWQRHPTVHQRSGLFSWKNRLGEKCPTIPESSLDGRLVRMTGILPFFYLEDRLAAF